MRREGCSRLRCAVLPGRLRSTFPPVRPSPKLALLAKFLTPKAIKAQFGRDNSMRSPLRPNRRRSPASTSTTSTVAWRTCSVGFEKPSPTSCVFRSSKPQRFRVPRPVITRCGGARSAGTAWGFLQLRAVVTHTDLTGAAADGQCHTGANGWGSVNERRRKLFGDRDVAQRAYTRTSEVMTDRPNPEGRST